MKTRNTRQKELIVNTLKMDKSHPTILELYKRLSSEDSNIGQATIYRNVNKLLEEGKIMKIPISDDVDRYDGNPNPHYHFMCESCRKMIDIFEGENIKLIDKVEKKYNLKVNNYNLLFEGLCEDCQ